MIWSGDYSDMFASTMQELLASDSFTLEDLLDQEELIQEVRQCTEKLVTFLSARHNLDKLLQYSLEPIDVYDSDTVMLKRIFAATEVLCLENERICKGIAEDKEFMEKLYSILNQQEWKGMSGSNLVRLLNALLNTNVSAVVEFFQSKSDLFERLTSTMHTGVGMNLLVKLVLCDQSDEQHDIVQWMIDNDMVAKIIHKMAPEENESAHHFASECLVSLLSAMIFTQAYNAQQADPSMQSRGGGEAGAAQMIMNPRPLTDAILFNPSEAPKLLMEMLEERHIDMLLEYAFSQDISSVENAISVLSELLQLVPHPAPEDLDKHNTDRMEPPAIVWRCIKYMPKLANRLTQAPEATVDGKPAVGLWRWKALDFLASVCSTRYPAVCKALVSDCRDAVSKAFDLFAQFPNNNLVHNNVVTLVACVLEAGNPEHKIAVCVEMDLCNKIMNEYTNSVASSIAKQGLRPPNAGHLIELANCIQRACEVDSDLTSALSTKVPKWSAFYNCHIVPANDLQATLLGGQLPPTQRSMQEDNDNDEETIGQGALFMSQELHDQILTHYHSLSNEYDAEEGDEVFKSGGSGDDAFEADGDSWMRRKMEDLATKDYREGRNPDVEHSSSEEEDEDDADTESDEEAPRQSRGGDAVIPNALYDDN